MDSLAHRIPAVTLGICGFGIAVVSARMNYFGAHVLVPGVGAETVAWGAVLSEFVKPFWLTGFFLLLRRWRIGEALAVFAMGILLHTYSLVSVIGSSAEGRNTVISEREGKQNALALAQAAASAAKAEADRVAGSNIARRARQCPQGGRGPAQLARREREGCRADREGSAFC